MRKLITFIFLIALVYFGWGKIKKNITELYGQNTSSQEKVRKNLPTLLSPLGLGQYLRAAKSEIRENLSHSQIPSECHAYITALQSIDLIYFRDPNFKVTYQQIPNITTSCTLTNDDLALAEKEYLKNCLLTNPSKTDVLSNDCVSSLYVFRARLTRFLFKDKKITEIENLPVLTDLMFAELSLLGSDQRPDFRKIKMIANQMLDQNAGYFVAKKMKLFADVMITLDTAKGKTDAEKAHLWSSAKEALADVRQGSNQSGGLEDLQAFIETHGLDPKQAGPYAAQVLAGNPNHPRGLFLRAYSEWMQGNHESAQDALKRAVEFEPNNQEYRQVLESLSSPGVDENTFKHAFKMGVSLQDFDN